MHTFTICIMLQTMIFDNGCKYAICLVDSVDTHTLIVSFNLRLIRNTPCSQEHFKVYLFLVAFAYVYAVR